MSGLVLVATRDEVLLLRSTTALKKSGFEVVTAYSPAIAEYILRRSHNVRAVVIDARILGPICKERPGPILPASPGIPLVVANASLLDAARRAVVASYHGRCVEDGADTDGLIRTVRESLLPASGSSFPVRLQPRQKGTILLLDGDDCFRTALAEVLRADGHSVSEYPGPGYVPALASLREVVLVITEYQMPGEDGIAFADRIHVTCPTVPVLIVTAYWTQHFAAAVMARDFLHFLRKPMDYSVLHTVIRDLTRTGHTAAPKPTTYDELDTLISRLHGPCALSGSERRGKPLGGGAAR